MNVVSFSLYGSAPLYLQGALRNAEFIENFMDGWKAIYYVDNDIPESLITQLESLNAKIIHREESWHNNGMFWRFQAFLEKDFNYVMIRDVDSRISTRELTAINAWLDSGKLAHIIRDHPYHSSLIMGGLWGSHNSLLCNEEIWIGTSKFDLQKGDDQNFLNEYIYPIIKKNALVHDSFFGYENDSKKFPTYRYAGEFCGEVINEFELHDLFSRQLVINLESSRFKLLSLKLYSRFLLTSIKLRSNIKI